MKKRLIASISFLYVLFLHAQNIQEMTYTDNDKTMDAFGFSNPICNKEVLVNNWKTFIKKQNGKIKGGIVNKVKGTNIKFSSSGEEWNGNFAYSYNEDNTMTIFTSFQNIQGDFLTAESSKEELKPAVIALEKFRLNILKSCYSDDLNNAKTYSLSLNKQKIRNLDNIKFLEGAIRKDSQRIEVSNSEDLSDKEITKLSKIKNNIEINKSDIQNLTERNKSLDEEIQAQQLVISDFQSKIKALDELNNNTSDSINDIEGNNFSNKDMNINEEVDNINEDNKNVHDEYQKKLFDK